MTLALETETAAPPQPVTDGREGRPISRRHTDYSSLSPYLLGEKGTGRTIALASLALFAALCVPAVCGRIFTADDLGAFHLPLRAFYASALAGGDSFDWCPGLFGGFYLTGEGQLGTYHPLHWLLYLLLPLTWAWNIECLASYPFLFGGVWLLLRGRGFRQSESLFGALTFTFCGFNLLHFVHVNAIAVVAHIPWLLAAIDRSAARRADCHSVVRCIAVIAALTGSQLLLGYPQYVLYSLIAEALYLVFVLHERRSSTQMPPAVKLGAVWGAAKLLGLALAAVQILPTFEAVGDSVRAGADSSFSGSGSLHPLNLLQLVAPYLFRTRVVGQNTHELGIYAGCVPLLLAIVALANRRSLQLPPSAHAIWRFALLLVVLGVVMALGKHGPLHRWLGTLPFVGYFRFPCRSIVLFHLGIGLLATIGCTALCGAACRAPSIVFPRKTVGFVIVVSVVAAAVGPQWWPEHIADVWHICIGPALFLIAAALLLWASTGNRLAIRSIAVLTAIDLGAYGLSYAVYRDVPKYSDYVAGVTVPTGDPTRRVALDLASTNTQAIRAGNQILLRGYGRIDGYAGLEPVRRLDYRQPAALRVAGVTAVAAAAPLATGPGVEHGSSNDWLQVASSLPRARLVYSVQPSNDPAADIAQIHLAKEVLIDHEDRALVAAHLAENTTDASAVDRAQVQKDRPGKISVDVSASRPAVLVLGESYHRGWQAALEGAQPAQRRELQIVRVNGDFLGCLVPAGRFSLEFRFAPASLRYGRLISICSLGLLVLLMAAVRVPRIRASLSA